MRQPPAEGPRAVEWTAMMQLSPLASSWKPWTASWPSKAGESNRVMSRSGERRDLYAAGAAVTSRRPGYPYFAANASSVMVRYRMPSMMPASHGMNVQQNNR